MNTPRLEIALDPQRPIEPPRLLASLDEGFEKSLVAAADQDRMPAAARERLARALGVPNAPLPAHPSARAARIGRGSSLASWGAAGALSVVLAHHFLRSAPEAVRPDARVATVQQSASPMLDTAEPPEDAVHRVPTAISTPHRDALVPHAPASTLPPPAVPAHAGSSRGGSSHSGSSHATTSPVTTSPTLHSLRPELSSLARIQSGLRAGHMAQASDALGAYRRNFPQGELALEAELLGVDIALAEGNNSGAQALARAILARPEGGHYRQRLEALLARGGRDATAPQRTLSVPTSRSGGNTE